MEIFKDENLNIEFKEFGFVKLNFFNKKECDLIKKFSKKIIKTEEINNEVLNYIPNVNTKNNTANEINIFFETILNKKTNEFFKNDYEFFNCFLFIKKRRSKALHWHSDTTMYDQKKYTRAFTIWSGIEKTTKKNGCFRVVPRSHKLAFNYEPYPICNMQRNNNATTLYNSLIEKHAIDIPLKYGEVIIHDQSLIHASYPNSSFLKKRIAYKLLFIPKNVNEFKICFQNPLSTNSEFHFYSLNKNELKTNSSKYFSDDFSKYDSNLLIDTIKFNKLQFPFKTLSDMEKIMNSPIITLKSKFEIY